MNEPSTLFYNGYKLCCDVKHTSTETVLDYTTVIEGYRELRAQYKASRAVWDTLEVILGSAYGAENLHFAGYWVAPSNQDLIDRILQGLKPSGSIIYSDAEQSPEQTIEMAWLTARLRDPQLDPSIEVIKVPARDGHTKFLLGRTKLIRDLMNWEAFVELAKTQSWDIQADWGSLKPLELLTQVATDFEFPTNDQGYWRNGLALGYHPATTASLIDGTAYLQYID